MYCLYWCHCPAHVLHCACRTVEFACLLAAGHGGVLSMASPSTLHPTPLPLPPPPLLPRIPHPCHPHLAPAPFPASFPAFSSHRLDVLRKGMGESADRCRKLEREYQWIPSEKAHFGRPGSDYDWEANDADKVGRGGRKEGEEGEGWCGCRHRRVQGAWGQGLACSGGCLHGWLAAVRACKLKANG